MSTCREPSAGLPPCIRCGSVPVRSRRPGGGVGATAARRGVIRHCTAVGPGGYTPSDFPLAQLNEDRLAALHRRYPDMEDVWPLAPMQHEILLHARHAPETRAGHHLLCLSLEGAIDAAVLERAWRALPARHAALRVAIADDGMITHQVVRRRL